MNWVQYANQGAIRNQPLAPDLLEALSFLPEMGVEMKVYSGGQAAKGSGGPRTGSTRHDHGNAADADFYYEGRKLDWNNPEDVPIFQEMVRRGKQRGITGWGAGDDYMGAGRMHVGFGNPGVWGAGGKGANAPGWLREAYHGEPGHVHKPGDEGQVIADATMAALGKPVQRPTISGGGGTSTAIGGSGADTMAEPTGLLGKFARTEDNVGGLLGMMFKNMTPDRADQIRAGFAGMQGIGNQGVYNAATSRMQARRDADSRERGFEHDQALQQQRIDAQNAERQQQMQAEAQRRERARLWVAQNAPEQLGAFDAGVIGVDDVYKIANPAAPTPTDDMREYEAAKAQGYTGTLQEWIEGQRKAGAPSVSTTVNTGNEVDSRPIVDKPDKGYQRRWDPERQTFVDEPIPGSDVDTEIQTAEDKDAERARQTNLKMGQTLENLHLNINELEDGGVPVTGVIGEIGSWIPGSQATDFRNRTTQISTRAALDEVQNMRDNSPTGGAVGQLTDSEREAIGLAATSLSNASSKDEYLRAAKKFREIMLDTAYGKGQWRLDKEGQVSFGSPSTPAGDFTSDTPPAGLDESDAELWKYATPEERQAIWGQ